jgi:hypothetical protein
VIWSKFRWIMMACIGDCTLREVEWIQSLTKIRVPPLAPWRLRWS